MGKKYTVSEFLLTHGSWASMRQRCRYNTKPGDLDYDRYAGRGIDMCSRWESFERFIEDMGPRPSKLFSLDRIDNNKGYFPGNCRWADAEQQAANTSHISRAMRLTFDGCTLTLHQWSKKTGLERRLIHQRLKSGWPTEKALTVPVSKSNGSFVSQLQKGNKLTKDQVLEMVVLAEKGDVTAEVLGQKYGVSGVSAGRLLRLFGLRFDRRRKQWERSE